MKINDNWLDSLFICKYFSEVFPWLRNIFSDLFAFIISFTLSSGMARQRSLHRARPSCFLLLRSCGQCQSRLVFPLNYHQDTFQTTPPCCLYYCLPHRFLAFSFVPLWRMEMGADLWFLHCFGHISLTFAFFLSMHTRYSWQDSSIETLLFPCSLAKSLLDICSLGTWV